MFRLGQRCVYKITKNNWLYMTSVGNMLALVAFLKKRCVVAACRIKISLYWFSYWLTKSRKRTVRQEVRLESISLSHSAIKSNFYMTKKNVLHKYNILNMNVRCECYVSHILVVCKTGRERKMRKGEGREAGWKPPRFPVLRSLPPICNTANI